MDDFFDDPGLDDLNDDVLQELESNAIQFTQARKLAQSQAPPPQPAPQPVSRDYGYGFDDDDDLDDSLVIDELAQLPVRHPAGKQPTPTPPPRPLTTAAQQSWNQARPSNAPFSANPRYSTSSVGAPAQPNRPPAYPSQRPPPRPIPPPSRYGAPPGNSQYMRPPPPPLVPRPGFQPSQAPATQARPGATPQNPSDLVAALQARVHALEAELTSTKGEVAIVRSKYDKSLTTHEAEVARLKKQTAEALSKQERLVEQALAAERTAATELQFTRQDLKAELEKAKKGRREGPGAGATTPKKARSASTWGNVPDGFDDVEILPSPSKGPGGRGKSMTAGAVAPPMAERTPTKGKRKRPAMDSPVMALEIQEDGDAVMIDVAHDGTMPMKKSGDGDLGHFPSLPYDFLKLLLDHSGFHGQPLTFDLLARYAFPSDPSQSIASLIFQKLPFLGNPEDPVRILIDFCNLLLDLWSQCLKEKYHAPIYDLVSLVSFILQLNTIAIAPHVISTLVPVAQTTVFLIAIPRFQSSDPDGDLSSNDPDGTLRQLCQEIDTEGALQVMYLAALGCMALPPEEPLQPRLDSAQMSFWKLTQPDFVLALLSPKQSPDDFLATLSLICTSVLPGSIGPITSDPDKNPAVVAQVLIDRVSLHMKEPPRWASTSPAESRVNPALNSFNYKQCLVRLASLRALMAFARSPFGAQQLALSNVALPRLVAVLCGAIDALYDMDVPQELFPHSVVDTVATVQDEDTQMTPTMRASGEDPEQAQDNPPNNNDGAGPSEPVVVISRPRQSAVAHQPDPTPLIHILISSATLLLHAVVTDPATSSLANMPHRLASSHGGSQRYLLTLARLNFAEEDLVLEAGIDADTVERAHELLELAVTPDEGDSISEVFSF